MGSAVIIENVGQNLPRKLYPLFSWRKAMAQKKDVPKTVYIDKEMQSIDAKFEMYVISCVSSPDFGSELSLMANFINFGVTIEAFEAQILSILLKENESLIFTKQMEHRR